MRVAVILLACVTALASAQYNQDVDSLPQKGPPLRSARFQRLPSARPALPTQTALANQRIRRPITFRPRGPEDNIGTGPGSYAPIKSLRPNLPTGPAPPPPQVKPVNEEPDEEIRNREPSRERDNQDDDTDLSDEPLDSQEESEENPPRAVGNLGSVGSISRTSSNIGPTAQTVQYRPVPGTGSSTGRGNGIPTAPASAPIQYRPAPKPNKPRKPIEESFKQQVKPPTKPVKSSQSYDSRGKKPVAQIIRRYRNDNPDGSITWGFENDDGSYKEEIIGVDCITRGKYGYIDPDGIRREYTYETGIKCDEEQRDDEENGFVDYQENKLVLPDGKTIDLSSMGKKQARRPRFLHRN
ncbi:PREDICTED: DNA topoisomerase 1-like [Eufriesea mexicana]|uniref:DNA topoisomerase 1-like n=1 Tax=Eufriesea mexicana TaxID=516756 RepID=UPI00083BBFC9|nr:PREDICTED: DNA topoisomerase 1-like [Eufriesea mexicana]